MHQLLNSIAELPQLNLKKEQWQQLESYFSAIDLSPQLLTDSEFKKKIRHHLYFIKPNLLIAYLSKWLTMIEHLLAWNKLILLTWQENFPKKELGNDDLLDITTELLPNEFAELENILTKEKLFNAAYLSHGEVDFALTNLDAAIRTKIKENQALHSYAIEISAEAKKIIIELYNKHYLQLVHETCLYQKAILFQEIEKKVKGLNRSLHANYFTKEDPDKIIRQLWTDLKAKTITLPADENLSILLDQHQILNDMVYTIVRRGANTTHKCAEFLAKLAHHKPELEKGKHSVYQAFFSDRTPSLSESNKLWISNLIDIKMSEKFLFFSHVLPLSLKQQAAPLLKVFDFSSPKLS